MKLIILAFILSLSLHFLLFSPFNKQEQREEKASSSKNVKKSSVHYVKLMQKPVQKKITKADTKEIKKHKKIVEKKLEVKKEIIKKVVIKKPKPKVYKKVEKKKIIAQKKKRIKKEPKKITPKPIKKAEVKPTFTKPLPKKVEIKPQEKRKTIPKKSLENFLLKDPVPLDVKMLDAITQKYLKLYGEEYNSFTKVQKVYLQKNLKNIGHITQKYLKYPHIAVRTKQQGMNIVEFFLHPNGDITNLKLTNSSGYSSLDKNSIETIEIAYKDYPRPKTKTKIKIYVYYKLY